MALDGVGPGEGCRLGGCSVSASGLRGSSKALELQLGELGGQGCLDSLTQSDGWSHPAFRGKRSREGERGKG